MNEDKFLILLQALVMATLLAPLLSREAEKQGTKSPIPTDDLVREAYFIGQSIVKFIIKEEQKK